MTSAVVIRDAAEVRGIECRDPWRKALLIVRNVEPGAGWGGKPHDREVSDKVSAAEFAREVNVRGWGVNVIARTITAWNRSTGGSAAGSAASHPKVAILHLKDCPQRRNRAADAGLVPPAADVKPGDDIESPEQVSSSAKWHGMERIGTG